MSILQSISRLHRASHQAFPTGKNGSVFKRLKFIARSWPHRQPILVWLELLERDPFLASLARCDYRLHRKLYRPYLSSTWDKARTLEALRANYAFFQRVLPAAILQQIFLTETFALAQWTASRTYQLRLAHNLLFYQEGEVTLSLLCPELGEGELALLTGTVAPAGDGTLTFYIGGLQGASTKLGAPAIKESGRDLHGLRPKSLILAAAQLLASQLGCRRILATSAACHAYSTDDRRQKGDQKKMFFDYDSFWEESNGQRDSDAFFAIPLTAVRRPREDMKPQKRPMYQRRYAMLDEVETAIAKNFQPQMDADGRRFEENRVGLLPGGTH